MNLVLRFALLIALLQPAFISSAGDVVYLRDVKPLLEHKCYSCHAALKQQGGLRLDTAASLIRGGDSGAALVAGKPNDSLLIDVLTGDAGFQMPPASEGTALTDEEVQIVRQWISDGAPLPDEESPQIDPRSWWSYQPLRRPSLAEVDDRSWCRNEIDTFVAAAREARDLPVAKEATKPVWLRRVFVDLIGLPPTREELHRFLRDDSPSAYETVVDDLLSRPQYGERWGRHWMDVWRYSDWYGSRGINEIRYSQRHIWRWRDWIVQSLNGDKGYDQMIREMLAADEIAGGDPDTLPATGFLGRNWYKFDRNAWLFETVERTGEAFLGLTLRCCRCHDHKFDPITQEEYYRFRAFFEPHDVRTDPISALTETQKDATLGQVLKDGIAIAYDQHLDAPTFRLERGDSRYPDKDRPLSPGVPNALGGSVDVRPIDLPATAWYPMLRPELRQSLIEKVEAEVTIAAENCKIAERLDQDAADKLAAAERRLSEHSSPADAQPEVLLHDDFRNARPGTWEVVSGDWSYQQGKLLQSEVTHFATLITKSNLPADFDVHLRYRPLAPGTYRSVGFSFDYRDQGNSQDVYTSTGDDRQTVQAFHRVDGKQVYPQAGIVSTSLEVGAETILAVSVSGSTLTIDLDGQRKLDYVMPVKRREGKFALWVHQGSVEFLELRIAKRAESLETLSAKRRETEQAVELARAQENAARGAAVSIRKRLASDVARYLDGGHEATEQLAQEALAAELAADVLNERVALLKAADSDEKRAAAEKAFAAAEQKASTLEGIHSPVGEQFPRTSTGRRTALADWIIDADNPRTARVAANHIWMRHFGQPLVATTENFGLNGRQPTHPELLDWLATRLIAGGWQMKSLHRQIVLSSTYRMTSDPVLRDSPASRGTENRREQAVAAMNADPDNRFLWKMNARRMEAEVVRDSVLSLSGRLDLTAGGPEIAETDGETVLRRSLYFRNTPNEKMPILEIFDVADPNGCYRRKESIVPHQSLALMNSGLALDSARTLAGQLSRQADFITAAFEAVLGRPPSPAEQKRCERFLAEHAAILETNGLPQFSAGGSAKLAPADDPTMRAKENLVHVLLLHNDFVTLQ